MSIFTKNGKPVSFGSLSWKERLACVWLLVAAFGIALLPVAVVCALGLGFLGAAAAVVAWVLQSMGVL